MLERAGGRHRGVADGRRRHDRARRPRGRVAPRARRRRCSSGATATPFRRRERAQLVALAGHRRPHLEPARLSRRRTGPDDARRIAVVVVFTRDLRVRRPPGARDARRVEARRRSSRCSCSTTRSSRRRSTGRTAPGSCSSRSPTSTRRSRALGGAARASGAATGSTRSCASRATSAPTRCTVGDDVSGYASHARCARLEAAAARGGIDVVRGRRASPSSQPGAWCTPATRRPLQGVHAVLPALVRRRAVAPVRAAPAAVVAARRPSTPGRSRARRPGGRATASPDVDAGGRRGRHDAARRVGRRRELAATPTATTTSPATPTSRLSPYLHFGCVSPLEVARAVARTRRAPTRSSASSAGATSTTRSSRPVPTPRGPTTSHAATTWHDDPERSRAWKDGRTGYPVVDAGMRQLRREGFMHNRARHDRGVVPHQGPLRRLARRRAPLPRPACVDGDLANNNLNWQWVAGTGTDTNPHRVFNPTVQGTRFDPDGDYVRRYVPELRAVDGGAVHDPDAQGAPRLRLPRPRSSTTEASRVQGRPRPPRTCVNRRRIRPADAGSLRWRSGQPSAMVPTNCWSWRRLRHSKTPSQYLPYSETIESPVSQ